MRGDKNIQWGPPDRLSHILNTFDQPCNISVLEYNRVSSILRCGSRGVLAEVDVPDECDVDRFERCNHVEADRIC
jgi:hypothetical protein